MLYALSGRPRITNLTHNERLLIKRPAFLRTRERFVCAFAHFCSVSLCMNRLVCIFSAAKIIQHTFHLSTHRPDFVCNSYRLRVDTQMWFWSLRVKINPMWLKLKEWPLKITWHQSRAGVLKFYDAATLVCDVQRKVQLCIFQRSAIAQSISGRADRPRNWDSIPLQHPDWLWHHLSLIFNECHVFFPCG
jgi:hypothetical protein